jgi:hypothetical protein
MAAQRRPIPADFEEHMFDTYKSLRVRYHTQDSIIKRWKLACGYQLRRIPAVSKYSVDGELIATYPSIGQAAKANYISSRAIRYCLSGETKSGVSGGFRWRYEDD